MNVLRKAYGMRSLGNRAHSPPGTGVAAARGCAVAILTLLALIDLCSVCCAGEADPTTQAPTIYSETTKVRIPVRSNEAALGDGIQLVFSRDGGRTWKVHDKWAPSNEPWVVEFPADGRYLLAFRTVIPTERMTPPKTATPEFVVVVDSAPPRLTIEDVKVSQTRVDFTVRATDPNLTPASLQCTAWREGRDGARTEEPLSKMETIVANGALEARVSFIPKGPGKLIARCDISDAAKNIASAEKTVVMKSSTATVEATTAKAEIAARRARDYVQQVGLPPRVRPVVPMAMQPGPTAGADSPSAGPSAGEMISPEIVLPPEPIDNETLSPPNLSDINDLPTEPGEAAPLPAPPDADGAAQLDLDEVHLRAARNSVAMGNIPEALGRFEQYLRLVPTNHAARFEYAGLLLQARQLTEASRQLEQLVAEQSHVAKYRMSLAEVLVRLKRYETARDQLQWLLSDAKYRLQASIMIARTYVLEQRLAEAQKLYDELLADNTNLSREEKLALARLLIDMQRLPDALKLLTPLYEAHRDDESISSLLVLTLVRSNRRIEALELIGNVSKQPLTGVGVWLELAYDLHNEQAYPEAQAIYQQICAQDPTHQRAALALVRTHLRLYEVDVAKNLLAAFQGDTSTREFAILMADYHATVGEYSEAIAIAKRLVSDDPHDLDAGIVLGDAYSASMQLQLAEATYVAVLQNCAAKDEEKRREIRRLLAATHIRSRRFDAAQALLTELLESNPADVATRIMLIETLVECCDFEAALALTRTNPKQTPPRERLALRTQIGYVLLKQGRNGEAVEEFKTLAADRNAAFPDAAYGLYRAATALKQPELAREALSLGPSPLSPAAHWAMSFANRALRQCDCRSAGAVLDDALKCAPSNVVLLNRRGEAAQLCDCGCDPATCYHTFPKIVHKIDGTCASPPESLAYFQSAVAISPMNIRARLGVARSFKKHLEYEEAYCEYKTLLKYLPQDVNLIRETGRLIEGWKGIERSGNIYRVGERAAASEVPPVPPAEPATGGFGVGALVGSPAPESTYAAPAELVSTEWHAKYLRGWRFRRAIPYYKSLIDMEPTNEAALFDLAQSQSALNRSECAIDTYQQILEINPCHADACTALQRNQLELRPKIIPSYDFQFQQGRDGLANITWNNFSLAERQPLGDENEYFEFGYRQRILQPTDDSADVGEIPYLHWQEKVQGDSVLFVDLAVEQYQYGIHTRPTFNTGLQIFNENDASITLSGFLKNYYANGEAIRQDIYWGGVQLDGMVQPLRLWTLSGYYRVAAFSDHNSVNWFNINSAHVFMQGRRQMRGIIDYNFYSFAHQTIFGPNYPASLVGTQFPYWSPSGYSFVTVGGEWKHWLSCDTFKGGTEKFYSLFFGGAVDSNGDGYYIQKTRWQHDFSPYVSWSTETNLTWSQHQIYNAVGVSTFAVFRIP